MHQQFFCWHCTRCISVPSAQVCTKCTKCTKCNKFTNASNAPKAPKSNPSVHQVHQMHQIHQMHQMRQVHQSTKFTNAPSKSARPRISQPWSLKWPFTAINVNFTAFARIEGRRDFTSLDKAKDDSMSKNSFLRMGK